MCDLDDYKENDTHLNMAVMDISSNISTVYLSK